MINSWHCACDSPVSIGPNDPVLSKVAFGLAAGIGIGILACRGMACPGWLSMKAADKKLLIYLTCYRSWLGGTCEGRHSVVWKEDWQAGRKLLRLVKLAGAQTRRRSTLMRTTQSTIRSYRPSLVLSDHDSVTVTTDVDVEVERSEEDLRRAASCPVHLKAAKSATPSATTT